MFLKISQKLASVLIFLILPYQSAWALDWNDPEWGKRGCPLGLEGVWKAETTSSLEEKELEFRKDGTLLIVRSGRDLKLKFKGDLIAGNRRFIDLDIISGTKEPYPAIMKIRPHLGPENGPQGSSPEERCRIKLFRYENQKRARQNREHSWDIFYFFK
ncbi:MAG: hypothetical protein G3M70_09105 [Candidatus Nitronauta litoralis]|uniref:Uncharacterized protein n=1 Tax=Candidatus Nitronauta litoralis TaxID=2705533 RepID=A0A7T0BWA9_9BACT|nr:MAG: hypothetical protein G3M70_09105 [Candidatus Nitronauta litoralis]